MSMKQALFHISSHDGRAHAKANSGLASSVRQSYMRFYKERSARDLSMVAGACPQRLNGSYLRGTKLMTSLVKVLVHKAKERQQGSLSE